MDKKKFNKPNILAEEALLELRNRLVDFPVNECDIEIENPENILKVFKVTGESNFGVKFIIVPIGKEALLDLLLGHKELVSLTKVEWSEVLSPSPSNLLVFKYFKTMHKAFKLNIHSNREYKSAFEEIKRILKENWEVKHKNHD